MKILLINPNARAVRNAPPPPLGVMSVAAMVKDDHEVRILDQSVVALDFEAEMKAFQPDLLGVSVLTGVCIADAVAVSRSARRRGVPVVWGGVHVSVVPEQVIAEDYVDFAVFGEGEITFKELVDRLAEGRGDFENVPGLAWKDAAGVAHVNERRPFIKDLDALPLPAWDLIDPDMYIRYELPLVTSRGCPGRCAFCYNQAVQKRHWRGRSADSVLREIDYVLSLSKRPPAKIHLKFYDDNFTANPRRAREILERLPRDYDVWLEMRLDNVTEDFMKLLKEFRGCYIFTGIESFDQEMLDRMGKDMTVEQIYEGYRLFRKYRIPTTASLLIGMPEERIGSLFRTVWRTVRLNPTRYGFHHYIPFPGTTWYDECVEKGLFLPPERTEGWPEKAGDLHGHNTSRIPTWVLWLVTYVFLGVSMIKFILDGRPKIILHKIDSVRRYWGGRLRMSISKMLPGASRE